MKSRYCYCPMTAKRIGHRTTLIERFRRYRAMKRNQPELYRVTGFNAPIYPGR